MINVSAERVVAVALRPEEAHATFRAVLDALSRPGWITRLPTAPLGVVPAPIVPVLALADLGTGVCVLDEDGGWTDAVGLATNAPAVALGEARLVAATRPVRAEELLAVHRGSAGAPEDGALVCLPVRDVDGGPTVWRLSGPGVDGERRIAPVGLPEGIFDARAEAVSGFPAGVDLLLVTPDGRILGVPRSTTVVKEG
ncbi:MAG TPA: phosphonate C-P lyase system protein PhnH [Micromonosporaceae bacterium]|nr:phosphonate C-P lyase system protein PhnH [Micromonosporaceae bacterium]